ncbi:hypothetical protein H072_1589 [Dactylellina haptotyla CBS 200.50]|uniref:DUF924-domain-containing protein n=1 Tax=Dactylellina haptotyla (strain CBS 200.50) TaxID=1284197 RepID=S8AN73_DACHA|nr:hypothetical protein H072_1589 [Dactylellina haptotyla CBS 200.50]
MAAIRTLNKSIFTPSLYQSIRELWFSGLPWGAKQNTEEATRRWFTSSKEAKLAFDNVCRQKLDTAILSLSPSNFPIAGLSDAEIAAPFIAEIEATEGGGYGEKTKTALSFMILLDQIPRNLYRTKDTLGLVYTHYDPIALSVVRHILSQDETQRLDLYPGIRHSMPYRQWFYMPLMHCESLPDHQNLLAILAKGKEEFKDDEEIMKGLLFFEKFEKMHLDIIEKFGRYPHRNDGIGRPTTKEEKEFMEQGGQSFGVGG